MGGGDLRDTAVNQPGGMGAEASWRPGTVGRLTQTDAWQTDWAAAATDTWADALFGDCMPTLPPATLWISSACLHTSNLIQLKFPWSVFVTDISLYISSVHQYQGQNVTLSVFLFVLLSL